MHVKMVLLSMSRGDAVKECRTAAVALGIALPGGIQLFNYSQKKHSWYISVCGSIRRDTLKDGIRLSRMSKGMASIWCEGSTFLALFCPR